MGRIAGRMILPADPTDPSALVQARLSAGHDEELGAGEGQ